MNITLSKKKKNASKRNFDRRVSQRRIVDLQPPEGMERREPDKLDRRQEDRRR